MKHHGMVPKDASWENVRAQHALRLCEIAMLKIANRLSLTGAMLWSCEKNSEKNVGNQLANGEWNGHLACLVMVKQDATGHSDEVKGILNDEDLGVLLRQVEIEETSGATNQACRAVSKTFHDLVGISKYLVKFDANVLRENIQYLIQSRSRATSILQVMCIGREGRSTIVSSNKKRPRSVQSADLRNG